MGLGSLLVLKMRMSVRMLENGGREDIRRSHNDDSQGHRLFSFARRSLGEGGAV